MAHERIVCDPAIKFGKPVIRGTRIKVELPLRLLGQGRSIDELLAGYPQLSREDVLAAQSYAADLIAKDKHEAAE